MKVYLKNIFVILIILILLFILTGCNNSEGEILNKKVKEELTYLDLETVSLINSLNNITVENYKISTKEISMDSLNSSGAETSSESRR